MKIIQIVTGIESDELVVLGLGDDGCLYVLEKSDDFSRLITDDYKQEYQDIRWRKML